MSWPASIFCALLTALLAMFLSGYIANLAVDWYHVSGREGASGYFVVALAILGFGAGLVIGLIVARLVAGSAHPGFLKATGISLGLVSGIGLLSGGVARALADVPPELDGEELMLAVEVRWPAGQPAPAAGADEASIGLHSIPRFSHTVRASERGPLWLEDAHEVDGRWVVPGAVRVFTSRGRRMLTVDLDPKSAQGFEVPLPAFPGRKNSEWSEWLPNFRPGVQVPPDLLGFRFRVRKVSEPIRTETIGPFEVATSSYNFYPVQQGARTRYASYSTFGFRYRGQPVVVEGTSGADSGSGERFESFDDAALLGGQRAAVLVHADAPDASGYCYLIAEDGDRARIEFVAQCATGTKGQVLTRDTALFRAAGRAEPVRGRIDRISYESPGLYLLGYSVVDSRRLTVHRFSPDGEAYGIPSVPPLGLSPDEHSFVVFGHVSGSEPPPLLLVTDFVANRTYTLPVDPARMRYVGFESLDPAWLDHHFEWKRQAGVDHLVERAHFVPLPWHGQLTVEGDGHTIYQIQKATEPLRGVLLDFLVTEFKAERQPADSDAYEMPVTIAGRTVNVGFGSSTSPSFVSVSQPRGSAEDPALVPAIARRFDALLATGKYDSLFDPR